MSIFGDKSFWANFWKRVKTNTVYRGKVREVLMSREASNINFNLLGIRISGTIFPDIANDIAGDKPTRSVVVRDSFDDGAAAIYDPKTNTMEVGTDPVNSRIWKGYVIHEAVHAWIDKSKLRPLFVDNEAVAYIAQAIYYRRVGVGRSRFTTPAYLSARDIGNLIIRGQTPTDKLITKLKSDILASPTYSHLTPTTIHEANDG
jgi:hypothetical protein